jgi:hypothetical protein
MIELSKGVDVIAAQEGEGDPRREGTEKEGEGRGEREGGRERGSD